MNSVDRIDYIKRYEQRLAKFGYSFKSLGWGDINKQDIRFSVLSQLALSDKNSSILDVGCGFADLYDFLISKGWKGKYTGTDIVPGLIKEAKKRHPYLEILEVDISSNCDLLNPHDYVIASGVMNAKLPSSENKSHIKAMIYSMFKLANKAVSIDFLSTYVDFQQEGAWHTKPSWLLDYAFELTPRVMLRHDYMRFEYCLNLFKEISYSERNVFDDWENI